MAKIGTADIASRYDGLSAGPRGHTPSYAALLSDVAGFLVQAGTRFPGRPVVLYGHSYGGSLVLNFLLRHRPDLTGALVTSPLLRPAFTPPIWTRFLLAALSTVAPRLTVASGVDPAGLSHDPEVVRRYGEDPLVHARVSLRMGVAVLTSGAYALEHAAELSLPVLLMQGELDPVSSPAASRLFCERANATCTLKMWPGMFHELHQEVVKGEVIACLLERVTRLLAPERST
jgi:alpha-beta hydrolase superfamily lysophospholipase